MRQGNRSVVSAILVCVFGGLALLGIGCGSDEGPPSAKVRVDVSAFSIKAKPTRIEDGSDVAFRIVHDGDLLTPFLVRGPENFRVQLYPFKESTLRTDLPPGTYKLSATNYGTAPPATLLVEP
jgi:hypothetical protein